MPKKSLDSKIDNILNDIDLPSDEEIKKETFSLKISIGNKGRKKPPRTIKHRQNISAVHIGKKHSEESCLKISKANIGKVLSKEICQKMSKSRTGKKKKPHTEETKKQISDSKIKLQGVKCYVIDPNGIRYDFDSIKECEIKLGYKNLTPNAVSIFPLDGSQKVGKSGKWKGWIFARII